MTHDPESNDLAGCLPAILTVIVILVIFAPELLILVAAIIRFEFFPT